jgi:hypothetical protein
VHVQQRVVQPVGQPGRLGGKVGVVTGEHRELDRGVLLNAHPSQRVGQGASSVGDDVRVAGVGLGLTGVQIGDPPHRQPRRVGDRDTSGAGHRDRQRTDRGELVDDHQHPPVNLQLVEQRHQIRLRVRQRPVHHPPTDAVKSDNVMGLAGDVDPPQNTSNPAEAAGWESVDVDNRLPSSRRAGQPWTKRRQPRYEKASTSGPCPYQRSHTSCDPR